MTEDRSVTRTGERRAHGWHAGSVNPCEGGDSHTPAGVHIVVRCVCGAAFMSTDGGIALGLAHGHELDPGVPSVDSSDTE